ERQAACICFPACCSDAEFFTDFQSALFCGNLEERVSIAAGHISSGRAPAPPGRGGLSLVILAQSGRTGLAGRPGWMHHFRPGSGSGVQRNRPMEVVLLPGLLCDASVWSAQVAALKPHANVAVADFSQLDRLEDMARSALALRPGPLVVIGHSMGARVALG